MILGSMKADDSSEITNLVSCLSVLKRWMSHNLLLLNLDKTEMLVIYSQTKPPAEPDSEWAAICLDQFRKDQEKERNSRQQNNKK